LSGEQLPAVNTWFKLIEIILLICTMATDYEFGLFYFHYQRSKYVLDLVVEDLHDDYFIYALSILTLG
jgi:hypothetical protein